MYDHINAQCSQHLLLPLSSQRGDVIFSGGPTLPQLDKMALGQTVVCSTLVHERCAIWVRVHICTSQKKGRARLHLASNHCMVLAMYHAHRQSSPRPALFGSPVRQLLYVISDPVTHTHRPSSTASAAPRKMSPSVPEEINREINRERILHEFSLH